MVYGTLAPLSVLLGAASVVSVDDTGAQYTPLRGPVYKPNTWTYDGR